MSADEELRPFATAAWRLVSSGIVGAQDRLQAAEPRFIACMIDGMPRRQLDRHLEQSLADAEWTWPWFEQWAVYFDRQGAWPFLWPCLEPDIDPDDDDPPVYLPAELVAYRRAAIAPLIASVAAKMAYRDRNESRPIPKWFGWRLSMLDDKVENQIAERYRPAVEAGDLTHLPPYFPGDRTTLQRVSRRRN